MGSEVDRALERSAWASPDDWEGWLVYADRLLDRGDERGQLILWEHRLATAALYTEDRQALLGQIEALVDRHQGRWLAGWSPPRRARLRWRRGALVGVELPWNRGTPEVLARLAAHPASE